MDAVGFLIQLEAIGLEVDPSRLVGSLIAQIDDRKLLTSIEFDILLYKHTLGKRRIRLSADPVPLDGLHAQRTHKDSIGNRFSVGTRGDLPYSLEISGPKYREPKPQEAVTCDLCGMLYVTNHPGDARRHKATHDRVVRRLNPKPSARLQKRVVTGIAGELVDQDAPLWMHGEVYERAAAFRRNLATTLSSGLEAQVHAHHLIGGHLFAGPGARSPELALSCKQRPERPKESGHFNGSGLPQGSGVWAS